MEAFCTCGAGLLQGALQAVSRSSIQNSVPVHRFTSQRRVVPCRKRTPTCSVNGGPVPEGTADEGKESIEFFNPHSEEAKSVADFGKGGRFSELPLFPLQVVLNPGTPIPLQIFEMRYRLLFNRIWDGDSRFGVVLYDRDTNFLARIGCCAELVQFERQSDGRILTNNIGRERFRIVKILEEKPYIRAIVEYVHDLPSTENCRELELRVWRALQDVLRLSNKLYEKVLDLSPEIKRLAPKTEIVAESGNQVVPGAPVNGTTPSSATIESSSSTKSDEGEANDPHRTQNFSFAVSQILDMPLKDQQLLLQMRDTGKRLKRQCQMLDSARQYLAAQVSIKEAGLSG